MILYSVFGIVAGLLTILQVGEWLFRKRVPIPKRIRLWILLGALFYAQFDAYRILHDGPPVVIRLPAPHPPSIADAKSTDQKSPRLVSKAPAQSPGHAIRLYRSRSFTLANQ